MIAITIIILFSYVMLIGSFIYGFDKVNYFESKTNIPKTKFSVVIPFRNEAKNLKDLIESIKLLDYPETHFEIIFVDDSSTDDSVSIIKELLAGGKLNWTLLKNAEHTKSPKKDAIKKAIDHSVFEWILTTDADCILPIKWLSTFDGFIQQHESSMIAGPVAYYDLKSFLDYFQNLDFLSLMGSTIGSFGINRPFMANGANLAYRKSFFQELNGFNNDSNIASGDDVFLLQKAVKKGCHHVAYLKSKNAIVTTKPESNWNSLISQRIRWASKSTSYKNSFSIITGFIVLLANYLIIVLGLLTLTSIINFSVFCFAVLIKILVDFTLIYKSSSFFSHKIGLLQFVFSCLLYPFFISYVAFLTTFKGYKWKNRTFHK